MGSKKNTQWQIQKDLDDKVYKLSGDWADETVPDSKTLERIAVVQKTFPKKIIPKHHRDTLEYILEKIEDDNPPWVGPLN